MSSEATVTSWPAVSAAGVIFRLPDAEHALAGVRLLPALSLPQDELEFAWVDGGWMLRLPRPPVWRMEYRLQRRFPDGGTDEVCDPGNPRLAPGAFGDKSVVEFADYAPPRWLDVDPVAGRSIELTLPAKALGGALPIRLWSPADAPAHQSLPLLVAHDGPEYDELAGLTRYSAALIQAGELPAHRVALLAPGDRTEEYSANPAYAQALAMTVLPALCRAVAVRGPVVGMGASLGALAMLHAQRRYPGRFGGLFLQSGSFFDRALDSQEYRRFSRFGRVTRFVTQVRRTARGTPVPVVLTCGTAEENLANNRQLAATLLAQGWPARLVEIPDAHNYTAWRDAFDPALTGLLGDLWASG